MGGSEAGLQSPARPHEQVSESWRLLIWSCSPHVCCRSVPGQLELLRKDVRTPDRAGAFERRFQTTLVDVWQPAGAR